MTIVWRTWVIAIFNSSNVLDYFDSGLAEMRHTDHQTPRCSHNGNAAVTCLDYALLIRLHAKQIYTPVFLGMTATINICIPVFSKLVQMT